jgi:hypothetical protein
MFSRTPPPPRLWRERQHPSCKLKLRRRARSLDAKRKRNLFRQECFLSVDTPGLIGVRQHRHNLTHQSLRNSNTYSTDYRGNGGNGFAMLFTDSNLCARFLCAANGGRILARVIAPRATTVIQRIVFSFVFIIGGVSCCLTSRAQARGADDVLRDSGTGTAIPRCLQREAV